MTKVKKDKLLEDNDAITRWCLISHRSIGVEIHNIKLLCRRGITVLVHQHYRIAGVDSDPADTRNRTSCREPNDSPVLINSIAQHVCSRRLGRGRQQIIDNNMIHN